MSQHRVLFAAFFTALLLCASFAGRAQSLSDQWAKTEQLLKEGKHAEAVGIMGEMLKDTSLGKNREVVLYNMAFSCIALKRYNEAVAASRELITLFPGDVSSMGMHGWALYLAGETQDAIEITRKALRIDTKPAFLHFNLGLYLLAMGKSDEAMTNYQNGLKVVAAPGDAEGSVADLEELEKQRPELKSAAAALRAQLETRMKEVSKAPSGANSPK